MGRPAAEQLGLFSPREARSEVALLHERFEALRAIAARLPPALRFGTSSWSFPGWTGLVYPENKTESYLAKEGLRLYSEHPLLRTVGIDRSYYAPVSSAQWRSYAQQLPEGFVCCAKAPSLYTSPIIQNHGKGGLLSPSPSYLDASKFQDQVLGPYLENMSTRAGPIIFEFPHLPKSHRIEPMRFAENIYKFFAQLPPTLPYAVELRESSLLCPAYVDALLAHNISHVYNYWTAMPMPGLQANLVPIGTGRSVVVRLLLRPGTRYDQRKQEFSPFDKIIDENQDMRDDVIEIIRNALLLGKEVFVLVNNKAEGSSPLTIEALAKRLGELMA